MAKASSERRKRYGLARRAVTRARTSQAVSSGGSEGADVMGGLGGHSSEGADVMG